MQRHRLPARASMVSALSKPLPPDAARFFCRANNDMTKPGVQKPHCEPWQSTMACCTLCNWPWCLRSSTLINCLPCKEETKVRQELRVR
ncbi:hypothetical protein D9M68_875540 [compost metagenome]